jgi:hypothetical protein
MSARTPVRAATRGTAKAVNTTEITDPGRNNSTAVAAVTNAANQDSDA